MTRKLLGVWFHLEKNVQGGPATIGGVQDNEVYGTLQYSSIARIETKTYFLLLLEDNFMWLGA